MAKPQSPLKYAPYNSSRYISQLSQPAYYSIDRNIYLSYADRPAPQCDSSAHQTQIISSPNRACILPCPSQPYIPSTPNQNHLLPIPNHDPDLGQDAAHRRRSQTLRLDYPITYGAYPPPATSNDSRNTSPTRQRIPVACTRCRRRKIRCSGEPRFGKGCQACRHSGADVNNCHFDRVGTIRKYDVGMNAITSSSSSSSSLCSRPVTPSNTGSYTSNNGSSASIASLPIDTGARPATCSGLAVGNPNVYGVGISACTAPETNVSIGNFVSSASVTSLPVLPAAIPVSYSHSYGMSSLDRKNPLEIHNIIEHGVPGKRQGGSFAGYDGHGISWTCSGVEAPRHLPP